MGSLRSKGSLFSSSGIDLARPYADEYVRASGWLDVPCEEASCSPNVDEESARELLLI